MQSEGAIINRVNLSRRPKCQALIMHESQGSVCTIVDNEILWYSVLRAITESSSITEWRPASDIRCHVEHAVVTLSTVIPIHLEEDAL